MRLFVRPGTPLVRFPLGSDIAGVTSIDAALTTVGGRRALADAILRRLTTPRGGLVGAPEYGFDVRSVLGSTLPMSFIEQRVLEQVLAEQEVADALCTATFHRGTLRIEIPVVDAEGPFDLTLTADELTTAALLGGAEIFREAV